MVRYFKCFSASRFPTRILDAVLIPPIWCYMPSSSHLQWQAQRPSGPRRTRLRGFKMGLQNEVTWTLLQIFLQNICYTSACSTILHMQRLLVMIFSSGMLFELVILSTVRWRRVQKQAQRKNAVEWSSQLAIGLNIVIKIKPPVWQSG